MSAITFETYQPLLSNMLLSEATHDDIMTPTIVEKGNTSNHQFQSHPITNGTQHEPSLSTALPQHEPSLSRALPHHESSLSTALPQHESSLSAALLLIQS